MPTDKRQRHKEGRQARRAAAIAQARRQQRRRRAAQVIGIAVVVLLAATLVSVLGGGDDDDTEVASEDTTTTTAAPRDPITCEAAEDPEADVSTKPEVQVPEGEPTGLECTDLVVGDGDEAAVGDTIEVHYVGVKASDGEQFDSSWDRGQPATFPLVEGGLIQGWVDGIPGMKVGGRRQLVIPAELAYGDSGHELSGETLVFVVDLVGVTTS